MSNELLLPIVDTISTYQFESPFNQLTLHWNKFKCVGIRRIGQWVVNNDNPWEKIYKFNQLSYDSYKKDVSDDVYILDLLAPTGASFIVPLSYIKTINATQTYPYNEYSLIFRIDTIPTDTRFEVILDEITDYLKDKLGVTVSGKCFPVHDDPIQLTKYQHDIKTSKRNLLKVFSPSVRRKLREAELKIDQLVVTRKGVEDYLLRCLMCSNCGRDEELFIGTIRPIEQTEELYDAGQSYLHTKVCSRPDDENAAMYSFMGMILGDFNGSYQYP